MWRNLRLFQDLKCQVQLICNVSGSPSILCSKARSIKSSSSEKDKIAKRRILALQIKDCFNFSECEALRFVDKNEELWQVSRRRVNKTIEFLIQKNVTTKTIIENPWLMTLDRSELIIC